jgi:hypothetical protein
MERYSKTSSSKWQSQYSEEFKRHVCNEFITGTMTRRAIEHKFKLGNSRLDCWLKAMGYNYSRPRLVSLSMPESTTPENKDSIAKLKRELEDAKLLAETYRKMIELAEQELKISIRKKPNTK